MNRATRRPFTAIKHEDFLFSIRQINLPFNTVFIASVTLPSTKLYGARTFILGLTYQGAGTILLRCLQASKKPVIIQLKVLMIKTNHP